MEVSILTQYIRPELTILPVVLYCIGVALKKTMYIKDNLIPIIIGFISLSLTAIYILSVSKQPSNYQEVLSLIFDVCIQGICCAAASVYANQLGKQIIKLKNGE